MAKGNEIFYCHFFGIDEINVCIGVKPVGTKSQVSPGKNLIAPLRINTIHKWVARLVTDDFIGSSVSFQALLHKRCSILRNVELSVQEEGA